MAKFQTNRLNSWVRCSTNPRHVQLPQGNSGSFESATTYTDNVKSDDSCSTRRTITME